MKTTSSATELSPDSCERTVIHALAQHLLLDPSRIESQHRLREDLGLGSSDLEVIALRLERAARRDFPLAVLELITSVQELVGFVRAWAKGARLTRHPAARAPGS
jgi:acyl carrier protein